MSTKYKFITYGMVAGLFVGCLVSCMAGGTTGTGLSYRTGGKKTQTEQVGISGVVLDLKGKAARGYSVVGQTVKNQEIAKTDSLGSFSMTLTTTRNEIIVFYFQSASGKKWKGTFSGNRIIDGDEFSVRLNRDGTASIRLFE